MRPDWESSLGTTVVDLFDKRLSEQPDTAFLDACGTQLTARDIESQANRIANGLAGLGVVHGDRVSTILENGPEAVLVWFAIHRLGAVAVPVNSALKGELLRHQLEDAGCRVVVVQEDLADRPAGVLDSVPCVEHLVIVGDTAAAGTLKATISSWASLLTAADDRPHVLVRPSDLGTIVYTGGTTGASKGCAISHNYHLTITEQINRCWRRTADDVVWTPLPLFHYNAISNALTGTLLAGGRAAISRRFSVSGFWPAINASGATVASLLGSLAVLVARADDHPLGKNSGNEGANTTLRLLTGVPLPPDVDDALKSRFGIETFSAAYGTTEASLISWLPDGRVNKPNAAGIVNDEAFIVKIFDDDDQEVAVGESGEIVVRPRRAEVMFDGYWNRPEATLASMRNMWLHTGDIGKLDDEGYLYFVDRKADYLRRRGENISSWEVEKVFHTHPDIDDVCVHAVASEIAEDDVKVTAVLRSGATLTEEQLLHWAVDQLPFYAVPRYVEFRASLPLSQTGRAPKVALKADGVTATTWDRESAGVTFERR